MLFFIRRNSELYIVKSRMSALGSLLAVLLIAISCWFGFEFVTIFVKKRLDLYTRVGLGCPFGIVCTSWLFYITNLYVPFSLQHGISNIVLIGLASGILKLINSRNLQTVAHLTWRSFVQIVLFPFIFVAIYLTISMLFLGKWVRGAVYGDLPFHLNLISSFVYGCNSKRTSLFGLMSPFFAGEPLAYPVLPDFMSAVLLGCFDTSYFEALVVPSIPIVFGLFATFGRLTYRFCGMKFACIIAPWLFIFMGGMGFVRVFDSERSWDINIDYVHYWGNHENAYWLQTVIHILLPQRASLFSLPICFGYLVLMMSVDFNNLDGKVFILCGLLVASLVQVQAHSIIALFEWTAAFAVINFPWKTLAKWMGQIKVYLMLLIPALVLSIPQALPYVDRTAKTSFMAFGPIWIEDGTNFFTMWWRGLGAFVVLALVIGPLYLDSRRMKLYVPALFVFAVSNFVKYQPWHMDNTKVFNAAWVPFAVAVVARLFAKWHEKPHIGVNALMVVMIVACCISGFLGVFWALIYGHPLWDDSDMAMDLAAWVRNNTPKESIWATDHFHNHPIATLAGRQILVGYLGWLDSHNLRPNERLRAMSILERDPENVKLLDKYNVSYACVHRETHEGIWMEPGEYSRKWQQVYDVGPWIVYRRLRH